MHCQYVNNELTFNDWYVGGSISGLLGIGSCLLSGRMRLTNCYFDLKMTVLRNGTLEYNLFVSQGSGVYYSIRRNAVACKLDWDTVNT